MGSILTVFGTAIGERGSWRSLVIVANFSTLISDGMISRSNLVGSAFAILGMFSPEAFVCVELPALWIGGVVFPVVFSGSPDVFPT